MSKIRKIKHFGKFVMNPRHMIGDIIQLMVDTKSEEVFHIDPPVGHAKAAAIYLGIPENEINDTTAGHLIPVHIEVKKGKVIDHIIVGRSSLELGRHVHHDHDSIEKAVAVIEAMIMLCEELHEITIEKPIKKHEVVFS